jgi:phage/plasmid-associated DNA primase
MYNKLYQSGSFELSIRAKLIINSNSPLAFDDDDDAIRNRILYVKFNKRFTKVPEEVDNMTIFPAATLLHFSTLTAIQKSSIFLYFAMIAKGLDAAVTVPVPKDILTKNNLINWKDFVKRHFTLNKDAFVSKELVVQLIKETYPDFEITSREIVKGLSELPADFNVIYQKGKQIQNERGYFYGLYSTLEGENFQPARDLAYEEELMALDSSARVSKSAIVDVTLSFEDMFVDFDDC